MADNSNGASSVESKAVERGRVLERLDAAHDRLHDLEQGDIKLWKAVNDLKVKQAVLETRIYCICAAITGGGVIWG